ncbi:tRNA uracil 4-sulfurtransferase ThiI [Effusibacillus lacus]|uniref:Probable tRNA sulfurtransferase n=1 Tax=Effusibacillus lacus TaxID=1348429 RepID=A0A292YNU6_9BACL|nr:tRNA uracil 4-sulfurtransferase ThiI [Effusibacillus lacus]TCS69549.1 thiamine biosynthesis protein ThiI [Effusibacillus lacus]GAX90044.1 tRNA 4-thiouridine(8) synthase ThiI [Effusibacillus lacus]
MYSLLIARYGEISIKGKNRSDFEKKLVENMQRAVKEFDKVKITRIGGRVVIHLNGTDFRQVVDKLRWVPGIVSMSPVITVEQNLDKIKQAAVDLLNKVVQTPIRFKVEARRADKRFPLTSPELTKELGAHILRNVPDLKVDVHNPELTFTCEIREEAAYLYVEVIPGPGGLPIGTSGKAMLLLSGGIDSPVAGWMTMKRGLEIEAIHFHSYPFTSDRARKKVEDLAKKLAGLSGRVRLHVVHFTEIQKAIRQHCPEELSITVMRRFMLRIADRLAHSRKALALVTGESLGQVASQTLESMYVINHVTNIPILRPLVAMDKVDIIRIAKELETYEISILPYEDCCTIFMPKSPRTRPRLEETEKAERNLDIEALVQEAIDKTESVIYYKEMETGRTE